MYVGNSKLIFINRKSEFKNFLVFKLYHIFTIIEKSYYYAIAVGKLTGKRQKAQDELDT